MISFKEYNENLNFPIYSKTNEYLFTLVFEQVKNNVFEEAEYKGRKVKLNKPMRGGPKKFYVYVKNPKTGNIVKVNFGDPNMKIKKNIPARRRSFRARHNCDNPGPRTKSRYWACRSWLQILSLIPLLFF